jgi:hypothetical protein
MRLSQVVALLAPSSTVNQPSLLLVLIVASFLPAAAQVREFQSPLTVPMGQPVLSTATADLNHDNHADIVATMKTSVAVILGDGQGRFRTAATYTLPNSTGGGIQTVIADFNNDGIPDLAVLTGHGYSMLFGNGDGSFTAPVNYITSATVTPQSIATADFNGDHIPDLAIGGYCSIGCNVVAILLNNGNGTFNAGSKLALPGAPGILQIGDVNNDGKQDIVATADGANRGNLVVFAGNGDGTFRTPGYFGASRTQPTSMILADLNNDGNLDIVYAVSPGDGSGLYVLAGNGKNNFQQVYGQSMSPFAASLAATDINQDGKLDVIVLNAASDIEVLVGKGDGTLMPPATDYADAGVFGISLADFNEGGNVDFASADEINSSVDVVFGDAKGTLQAATVNVIPAPAQASGDLNGDRKADIVAPEFR